MELIAGLILTYFTLEWIVVLLSCLIVVCTVVLYVVYRNRKKQQGEDRYIWDDICKHIQQVQKVYDAVDRCSDKIPENDEGVLREINTILEKNHPELVKHYGEMVDCYDHLNKITYQNLGMLLSVLSCVDWLTNQYFQIKRDKESRKALFVEYRDMLCNKRNKFSELRKQCNKLSSLKEM